MSDARLSVIVAWSENRVIGRAGDLPWRLPDDLKRFKRLTTGHPIVMGRKTWDSIGRPLPGRTNIVLSRDPAFAPDGAVVADSFDAALARAADAPGGTDEIFVIGGAALFEHALQVADRIYLTVVHANVEGDVRIAPIDLTRWHLVEYLGHPADDKHALPFSYKTYDRV